MSIEIITSAQIQHDVLGDGERQFVVDPQALTEIHQTIGVKPLPSETNFAIVEQPAAPDSPAESPEDPAETQFFYSDGEPATKHPDDLLIEMPTAEFNEASLAHGLCKALILRKRAASGRLASGVSKMLFGLMAADFVGASFLYSDAAGAPGYALAIAGCVAARVAINSKEPPKSLPDIKDVRPPIRILPATSRTTP
ncbi:MAG TPA: hypothetical protein VMR45_04525 [Patescibacteria group bacterium]|nr:hypothetical protein [Patescibacteria group bacterium]